MTQPIIGVFAPQYYASVQYYTAMARCSGAVVDLGLRYDKRFKSTHRCTIADTQGTLTLTVPVAKAPGARLWSQVAVSAHGAWWHDHRVSLESAYGRTPFFEFYIDRFLPFLRNLDASITELDSEIDRVVRRTCGIDTPVAYSADAEATAQALAEAQGARVVDFRRGGLQDIPVIPYYQVRAERFGFIPGLSILDLIFNMGTEAPLILYPDRER